MKILILGGAGFIGKRLALALNKHHEVSIFSNLLDNELAKSFHFILGDFTERETLSKALEGVDIVIHLISATVPSSRSFLVDLDINVKGTLGLLDEMVNKGVSKIIYFSSGGAIYGDPHITPVKENAPLNPLSSYAVGKLAIERYLEIYKNTYGLEPMILRPSNPYGPGQSIKGEQGAVAHFLNQLVNNLPITLIGGGKAVRDFIYIDDLISACVTMVNSFQTGVFNVGSGEGCSINDLLLSIQEVTNKKAQILNVPSRPFDVNEIVLDIGKIKETFKWQPITKLKDGIAQYWDWLSNE